MPKDREARKAKREREKNAEPPSALHSQYRAMKHSARYFVEDEAKRNVDAFTNILHQLFYDRDGEKVNPVKVVVVLVICWLLKGQLMPEDKHEHKDDNLAQQLQMMQMQQQMQMMAGAAASRQGPQIIMAGGGGRGFGGDYLGSSTTSSTTPTTTTTTTTTTTPPTTTTSTTSSSTTSSSTTPTSTSRAMTSVSEYISSTPFITSSVVGDTISISVTALLPENALEGARSLLLIPNCVEIKPLVIPPRPKKETSISDAIIDFFYWILQVEKEQDNYDKLVKVIRVQYAAAKRRMARICRDEAKSADYIDDDNVEGFIWNMTLNFPERMIKGPYESDIRFRGVEGLRPPLRRGQLVWMLGSPLKEDDAFIFNNMITRGFEPVIVDITSNMKAVSAALKTEAEKQQFMMDVFKAVDVSSQSANVVVVGRVKL